MKRYITELSNDLRKQIQAEVTAGEIPAEELEELEQAINRIMYGCRMGIVSERETMRDLVHVWDALADRKQMYSSEYVTLYARN